MQTILYRKGIPIRLFAKRALPHGVYTDEKLFVLTDIHGAYKAMQRLLRMRPKDARLVFLGDAVDRGPASMEVLEYLNSEQDAILLMGNHDIMAHYALHGDCPRLDELYDLWLFSNGGGATVYNYFDSINEDGRDIKEFLATKEGIPIFDQVYDKMKKCWQSGTLFFVHATLPVGREEEFLAKGELYAVSMNSKTEYHWAWLRPENIHDGFCDVFQRKINGQPVFLVTGHTIVHFSNIMHQFGVFLDTGYRLKTAAIFDKDTIQLVSTPCDEIYDYNPEDLSLFYDKNKHEREGVVY